MEQIPNLPRRLNYEPKKLPEPFRSSNIIIKNHSDSYIIIKSLLVLLLLILLAWAVYTFQEKDFSPNINVNNTINIPETNVTVKIDSPIYNDINPQLKFNVTIPVEIVNASE